MIRCWRPSLKPLLQESSGPSTPVPPCKLLLSESTKQGVLLELTVPWEDRLEEAFERKLAKYKGLVSECRQAGWRARCLPIKVGSRGFAARSLCRAFSLLGINGVRRRRAIYNTTRESCIFTAAIFYHCNILVSFSLTTVVGLYCIQKFSVNPPVTIVTIEIFTHSVSTLNKSKYMWINILILNTSKIMCTKNLCHIFVLTYVTSLLFQSFDAVIIIVSWSCSVHVTVCINHMTLQIFH